MGFDFARAEKEAQDTSSQKRIGAIVLGASGGGKSFVLGTLPGKILYLYTGAENHGLDSARITADKILPVQVDRDDQAADTAKTAEGLLLPDLAYKRLLDILADGEGIRKAGITSIAIDSASELEALVMSTQAWKLLCQTDKGKHNTYAEGNATLTLIRPIITSLQNLQMKHGIHYAITCALDVKSLGSNGEIEEASPRLRGYFVAESVIQQFGDVLVVGRMSKDGVAKHKFQFMTDVSKISKDVVGNVKKALNFSPRVRGVPLDKLPTYMDPDFKKLLELKTK